MPNKTVVVWVGRDSDIGVTDFDFIHDGKRYKVTPKGGASLEPFLTYVQHVCPKTGTSPFTFRNWRDRYNVERSDGAPGDTKSPEKAKPAPEPKKNTPSEGEQMSLKFARKMGLIASELQEKGLGRVAEMLKPIALNFRRSWLGPKSIGFFDDLGNANIQPDDAMSVIDAFEDGASEGPQIAEITGLEEPLCAKVMELAKKHLLC